MSNYDYNYDFVYEDERYRSRDEEDEEDEIDFDEEEEMESEEEGKFDIDYDEQKDDYVVGYNLLDQLDIDIFEDVEITDQRKEDYFNRTLYSAYSSLTRDRENKKYLSTMVQKIKRHMGTNGRDYYSLSPKLLGLAIGCYDFVNQSFKVSLSESVLDVARYIILIQKILYKHV